MKQLLHLNNKMRHAIPDRWIPYSCFGNVIEGTRIVCFKVPLKKSVQERKTEIKEIWTIDTLLQKIPKIFAVIDLTNTARYYDPQEFGKAGVLYKKILMPGRVIPPESNVVTFMDTVDEFLGKNDDLLIGVHCTHGLNRTGYMVCRYMRDRLKIPAHEAVKRFETARGYRIERDIYRADLLGEKPPVDYDPTMEPEIIPTNEETSLKRKRRHEENGTWRNTRRKHSDKDSSDDVYNDSEYTRCDNDTSSKKRKKKEKKKERTKSDSDYDFYKDFY